MNLADLLKATNSTISSMQTLHIFHPAAIPKDQTVAYIQIIVDICPQNSVPKCDHQWRISQVPGEATTQTADFTTVKLHLNSIVSKPHGKFCGIDINNLYLDTPFDHSEVACIATKYVPQQWIDEYNLPPIISNSYLHLKVVKGMYGLPQAGILANKLLKT